MLLLAASAAVVSAAAAPAAASAAATPAATDTSEMAGATNANIYLHITIHKLCGHDRSGLSPPAH